MSLETLLAKVATLAEALPYMRRYHGKTFVIKYGGHAMGNKVMSQQFARDIVLLKQIGVNPVVVHGGGPQIGQMLQRLSIDSTFVNGLRVTDASTVEVVEMVLCGAINKQIAADISEAGGTALGISGKDGRLITARKMQHAPDKTDSNIEKVLDLGFVGEPVNVNAAMLDMLVQSDIIPVIAPVGCGEDGHTYNINADTAAGAIAAAVKATRFMLLTDTPGVLDKDKNRINSMNRRDARRLIANGTITGGMIPKIQTCLDAVENGVDAAVILDGRLPHAPLLETFTEHGAGTMITRPGA